MSKWKERKKSGKRKKHRCAEAAKNTRTRWRYNSRKRGVEGSPAAEIGASGSAEVEGGVDVTEEEGELGSSTECEVNVEFLLEFCGFGKEQEEQLDEEGRQAREEEMRQKEAEADEVVLESEPR